MAAPTRAEDGTGGERDASAAQHLTRRVLAEADVGEVEPREIGRLRHDETGPRKLIGDEVGEQVPVRVQLVDEPVAPVATVAEGRRLGDDAQMARAEGDEGVRSEERR